MKKLVLDYVSRKFEFERHNTSIRIEVLAGLSTFLSLSYIFVVNPAILNEGGINKSVALFATVVTSALATFIMGWWAKKPFALAPGLEMNSYMVYFVIAGLGFSWQQGLGAIFWSGIIFLILTVTNIREKILDAIPDSLKLGLSASVGVFLMIIALRLSGVLIYEGITMNNFGNVLSLEFLILLIGFSLLLLFRYFNITGSVLYSIIVASFIANLMGLNQNEIDKITISKEMFTGIGQLDISVIVEPKMLAAIIILFVVDFYGSVAKFIGLTLNTTILKKDNKLPRKSVV